MKIRKERYPAEIRDTVAKCAVRFRRINAGCPSGMNGDGHIRSGAVYRRGYSCEDQTLLPAAERYARAGIYECKLYLIQFVPEKASEQGRIM